MSAIEILNEKIEQNLTQFRNLNTNNIQEKMNFLESLLKENNTIEDILLEFLELKKKNKDLDLEDCLRTYEVGINKNIFIEKIGNYDFIGKPAYDKIINLFNMLKEIINEKDEDKQLIKILEILDIENKKYKQTFPILFPINKELYFNSLIYRLIKNIKANYTNARNQIENKDKTDKMKEYLNKKFKLEKTNDTSKVNKINDLNKIINNIEICLTKNFSEYIINMSTFINNIYNSFKKKFENNDIFKYDKYNEIQKNDIYLFQDFIYFLSKFNFNNTDQMNFYSLVWEETFCPLSLKDINEIGNNFIMKQINKDLKITLNGKDVLIKNIDNYISDVQNIIKYFISIYKRVPDLYELERFLKFDKYDYIFIKSHWDILSDYIADILCSKTIKDIYKNMHNMDLLITDKNQIK